MGSSTASDGARLVAGMGVVLVLLASAEACDGARSSPSICDTVCDCIDCPEGYLAECEASLADLEREAANAGCSEELTAFETCSVDEFRCDNNPIDLDEPPPACVSERSSYEQCIGDGTGGGEAA